MSGIITGAPIWVWPLLALLVFIGLRARRTRKAPVGLVYALPLLGALALRSTAALPADGWIWLVFAAAYVSGGWGGYLLQQGWLLGREGRMVRLAGENLTLAVMMLVFWANFAGGFLRAVAPGIYGAPVFHFLKAGLFFSAALSDRWKSIQRYAQLALNFDVTKLIAAVVLRQSWCISPRRTKAWPRLKTTRYVMP